MQRLIRRLTHGPRNERGATTIMVALLIIPLIGFTALAVDIASMWAERQRLQTGADAAAIAIAQDCSRGDCGTPSTTANSYATANDLAGASGTVLNSVTPTTGTVTVKTSAVNAHLFAPVMGYTSDVVSAKATAVWGRPAGGTSVLPLTFSWCSFKAQTGGGMPSGTTVYTIHLSKTDNTNCTGPSGNAVPGGFGFLTTTGNSCKVSSKLDDKLQSDPGESPSNGCSNSDFAATLGTTVLLPIFDQAGGSGNNAWYRVYGYAAFKMVGYKFTGQYDSNNTSCNGNARCITGYFTRFVDISEAYTYSATAPALGAAIVKLDS